MSKILSMIAAAILSVVCAFCNRRFLDSTQKENHKKAFWDKGSASLCFVIVGLLGAVKCSDGAFAWKIVLGLVMGITGDQLMAARFFKPKYHDLFFAGGAGAFMFGHAFYVWALFEKVPGMLTLTLILGVVLTAISVFIQRRHKFNAARLTICGYLYMAVVSFMGAATCAAGICSGNPSFMLFAVGGLCFVASDNTLCVYCYGDNRKPILNTVVHVTYYAAQLLIAWSSFLV